MAMGEEVNHLLLVQSLRSLQLPQMEGLRRLQEKGYAPGLLQPKDIELVDTPYVKPEDEDMRLRAYAMALGILPNRTIKVKLTALFPGEGTEEITLLALIRIQYDQGERRGIVPKGKWKSLAYMGASYSDAERTVASAFEVGTPPLYDVYVGNIDYKEGK